jgi:hypothetical protein
MAPVRRRFPTTGFVPIGQLPVDRIGLSRRRGRELELSRAWTRVAGQVLAGKAIPAIRLGVLEVRMLEDDEGWRQPLFDVLPRLAASIARERPELGIEAVRLFSVLGRPIGPVQSLATTPED